MRISGDSINTFDVFINDFKIEYTPALKWVQVANLNWKAVDRLNKSDQYQTTVRMTSNEANIDELIQEIEDNRQDNNVFLLSLFTATDGMLFGANIDYGSNNLSVSVLEISDKIQKKIGVYSVNVTMKLLTDLDTGGLFNAGQSLPTLNIFTGYNIETDRTINYLQTYDNTMFYADRNTDAGVLKVHCIMDHDDMSSFKNYIRVTRGSAFSLPEISGISKPFGIGTTWPVQVKVKEYKEVLIDLNYWKCEIEFVQEN